MAGADTFGWVGRSIDDQFAVESVAGEGGFGVVYRGVHLGFEAPIAIKCLKIPGHVDKAQRAEIVARFRAEAKVLYRLSRLHDGLGRSGEPHGLEPRDDLRASPARIDHEVGGDLGRDPGVAVPVTEREVWCWVFTG